MGTIIQATAGASANAGGNAGASAVASASAGVGYDTQMPTTMPPLTTIFTPPPECKTPFVLDGECKNEFECDGSYMPFLYPPASENPRGTSIQCYPAITTSNNGFVDAVFNYSPGLFCPDGMTTAASISNVFLCCPSGLTYSDNGQGGQCTATITMGDALVGPWQDNEASIVSATSFSAADRLTLYASASPVRLTDIGSNTFGNAPSQSISQPIPSISGDSSAIGDSSTTRDSSVTGISTSAEVSSRTSTSNNLGCRGDNCKTTITTQLSTGGGSTQAPNPAGSDGSKSSDQNNLKIGLGVGLGVGGAIALTLLALGYVLLRRYREMRLLSRPQVLYFPPTEPNGDGGGDGKQEIQQIWQKKLPPELPVPEPWVELEGTQVEDRGPGIYVWKPELEGTAGVAGAKGIYVRKKSELEAKYHGTANDALGAGTVVYAESPIVGASFASPRYPRVVQKYT